MTISALLADLIAWSAQAACIAAIGGVLPIVLRVNAPGVRYVCYRAVLALCLVLPWLQQRQLDAGGVTTDTFAAVMIGVPTPAATMTASSAFPWSTVVLICIASGILARGAWILAGLVRLTRLRTAGYAWPWCQEHDELQRMLGTHADIRFVPGIGQPVTFGVRRPVVLLPDSLRSHALHVQRAVLSHELIHVQRRDWMWLVGEEVLRSIFWFHPGVWWLISRVQLSREEVVDELALLVTGTRRGYLEALAAFADATPIVPVAAFARRRHLLRRMRLIAKEAGMSSKRVAWSCAVMALTIAVGSWYAVDAFPMTASAQEVHDEIGPLEKQAKPITLENPIPRRTYSVEPEYPADAASIDANAMVALVITLDQFGRVAEIRRLGVTPAGRTAGVSPSSPDTATLNAALDALVKSAADAVRQWTYDPPADAPLSIRVTFWFTPKGKPQLIAHDGWSLISPRRFVPPSAPTAPGPARTAPAWAANALRVGGTIGPPTKTRHVNPMYPAAAQSAKVQGVVILETRIGTDGKVTDARVLRSVPLLDQAAIDAVMQWEFTPTRVNGEAVPVLMTVTVQFTLT